MSGQDTCDCEKIKVEDGQRFVCNCTTSVQYYTSRRPRVLLCAQCAGNNHPGWDPD